MNSILFGLIGMWETVAILAVVLILFGAKKVPELARGLGEGIREFKKASREVNDEMQRAFEEEPKAAAPAAPAVPAVPPHKAPEELPAAQSVPRSNPPTPEQKS